MSGITASNGLITTDRHYPELERKAVRILFVGVHNKPGMEPLDSRTKSGKMTDRVIAALQTEVGLFEADFIKTNLFDSYQIPDSPYFFAAQSWAKRVSYNTNDIVICLGAIVHTYFRKLKFKFIAIGHPSGVWSKVKQEEYIINACIKVSEQIQSAR